ncbi:Tm-1-like ATP-binding domain-containing protein [Aquibacillus koreensis]|uniref:Tm-1-like ATP-binding domain-containing protein n=1 Tax=Aquibacillus koreensis TaxID=279446 RepID=A0A9X3WLW8_9BACI|nr:Tm-1-like ATP-binding domain-containing protein [Aquibacillus koreensis]MCT2534793.1 Tm-1-like ATP-binding domain-containing protein [Aquibacillus koreensis]MDC3419596.1 Tm-1-like ATP-binding domain-containing protein [Aquibacillus koreensis]
MSGKVVLVGALDTKGEEYLFVKNILESQNIKTITVNTGVLDQPLYTPDVASDVVARAGGSDLNTLVKSNDRGNAVAVMTKGAKVIMEQLMDQEEVVGAFGMGGTAGTTVAASAMQALNVGVPKILVSTVASGNTRPYVGVKDITMMYSVIDIAGINTLSSKILSNAAHSLAGMVQGNKNESVVNNDKPMIGMTMFGVTTPCCTQIRNKLEGLGYDVLVFHATGSGGLAMEELIRAGFIKGVVDATTTELADELVGGVFSAGPDRLLAAGECSIPQVVSVGALDMVNFGPRETVPDKFSDRQFYQHNPTTTLMRTTVQENRELGRQLGGKVSKATSPVVVVFPNGGVSMLDTKGNDFDSPEAREALLQGMKETLRTDIPFIELEEDINDAVVANTMADKIHELIKATSLKEV